MWEGRFWGLRGFGRWVEVVGCGGRQAGGFGVMGWVNGLGRGAEGFGESWGVMLGGDWLGGSEGCEVILGWAGGRKAVFWRDALLQDDRGVTGVCVCLG